MRLVSRGEYPATKTNSYFHDDEPPLSDSEILNVLDILPGWKFMITVQSIISAMPEVLGRKSHEWDPDEWDLDGDYDYNTENPEITAIEMEHIAPGIVWEIAQLAFKHTPSEQMRLAIAAEVRELADAALEALEEIEPEDSATLINVSREKVHRARAKARGDNQKPDQEAAPENGGPCGSHCCRSHHRCPNPPRPDGILRPLTTQDQRVSANPPTGMDQGQCPRSQSPPLPSRSIIAPGRGQPGYATDAPQGGPA